MSLDAKELNARFRDADPQEIVNWALSLNDEAIVSTNFRPQEAVVLNMCTKARADVPVLWADSGYMMNETYRFAEKAIEQLKLNVKVYTPLVTRTRREAVHGIFVPDLDKEDEIEAFSEEVKLEPFRRALSEMAPKVWVTSLRKEQNPFRETLDIVSIEGDLVKVNPLFYWTDEQMNQYLADNNLPNETIYFDPTKVSEKRECGLHKPTFNK